jgi:DNA polymerase I-like protein with 3'-5' exonuclease and polymerase domains
LLNILDLEWDPDNGDNLLVVGWKDTAYPVWNVPEGVWDELADPSVLKIAFTKADHRIINNTTDHEIAGPFHDIQTMAWAIDERTDLDLAFVSQHYGAIPKDERLQKVKGRVHFLRDDGILVPIGEAPMDQLLAYNRQDLVSEGSLYEILELKLKQAGLYDYWLEKIVPYSRVLVRMEANGLPLNLFRTRVEQKNVGGDAAARAVELRSDAGLPADFNLNSPTQMQDFLFTKEFDWPTRIKVDRDTMALLKQGQWPDGFPKNLDITKLGRDYVHGTYRLAGLGLRPVLKVPKCAEHKCGHWDESNCLPSTSAKELRVNHFENPWVQKYCEYAKVAKALQFLDTWLEEERGGRIYARFNQTGTATGRLSSSDPNLQQVPSRGDLGKRFRALFRAPAGRAFVHGDFSQIEPRLMAHFSQDPYMLGVFRDGKDLYEEMTVEVLGDRYPKGTPERQLIRTCYLALGYGAKEKKISRNLAEEGFYVPMPKVKSAYRGIIELCHVFWDWKEEHIKLTESLGYVETLGGHRRHISWVDPQMRWKSENQAVNTLMQGSAADITTGAMVLVDENLPVLEPIAAVHDEALWEIDEPTRDEETYILSIVRDCAEHGHGYKLDGVDIVFEPSIIHSWDEK